VIGLDIMIDNANSGTSRFEDFQDVEKSLWKATRRPSKRGVLDEDPDVSPMLRLKIQCVEGAWPAMDFPGDTANIKLNVMRVQRGAKVAAVLFDSVGRFVAPTEESDGEPAH